LADTQQLETCVGTSHLVGHSIQGPTFDLGKFVEHIADFISTKLGDGIAGQAV
jgi:hypothetical protein